MLELDPFQEEVLDFFYETQGRAIYADDMGGRKTATTLSWVENTVACDRVLIIVPKAVHVDHWLAEAEVWAPRFFRRKGMGTKRMEILQTIGWGPTIYVTTYASARIDVSELATWKFDTVVFDEGHALKGRTTQAARMGNTLAKAKHCLIVTGTPVMNKPEEMWQYLHMLVPKQYRSFWRWVEGHFEIEYKQFAASREMTRLIGDYLPGHEELVREEVRPYIIQRSITELFPDEAWTAEPTYETFELEMDDHEKALYDALVEKGWGKTPSGLVTTKNALTVQTRLRQLTSDWGTVDAALGNSTKTVVIGLETAAWAKTGPVVVFTEFVESAHRLAEFMTEKGVRSLPYTGRQSAREREGALEQFRAGALGAIVGTYAAMSEGVDGLQHVSHRIVMYDLNWTAEVNNQAIGRLRRSGQTQPVEVRHYFYGGTVEARVVEANHRKINVVQSLRGLPIRDIIYGHNMSEGELVFK